MVADTVTLAYLHGSFNPQLSQEILPRYYLMCIKNVPAYSKNGLLHLSKNGLLHLTQKG
jgi:hypothetical protein